MKEEDDRLHEVARKIQKCYKGYAAAKRFRETAMANMKLLHDMKKKKRERKLLEDEKEGKKLKNVSHFSTSFPVLLLSCYLPFPVHRILFYLFNFFLIFLFLFPLISVIFVVISLVFSPLHITIYPNTAYPQRCGGPEGPSDAGQEADRGQGGRHPAPQRGIGKEEQISGITCLYCHIL